MEGTQKVKSGKWSVLVAVFLVVVFTFTLFSYTVEVRRPWFGKLSPYHHQWLTGSAVKFTKNWYREGALKLRFVMFEEPRSVEFPTLDSREPYISYPPGTIFPLYIISKLKGDEPGPAVVMAYNIANHLLIALFLALMAFFLLYGARFSAPFSFAMALVPPVVEMLMPAPLYWHQNVFFSDQAVILPIALFLFLEVIRDHVTGNKAVAYMLAGLQAAVFICGALTDWIFYFVAVAVFIKRILTGAFRKRLLRGAINALLFWWPAALALLVLALQLFRFHYDIMGKLLFRAGLSEPGSAYTARFYETFWKGYVAQGYGKPAIYILWFSLAATLFLLLFALHARLRKKSVHGGLKNMIAMTAMLTVPFFAQIYIFKNHSAIHDFSALKFSLTLALVPFVLLPCVALLFLERRMLERAGLTVAGRRNEGDENAAENETAEGRRIRREEKVKRKLVEGRLRLAKAVVALAALAVAVTYTAFQFPRYKDFFPAPGDYTVENFIAANTAYEDVVFSAQYEIPYNPPQQLSYSMKRVYKVESVDEIYEKVAGIEEEYVVNFLAFTGFRDACDPEIRGLLDCAEQCPSQNGIFLFKISEEAFLLYYRSLREVESEKEAALALAGV